MIRVLLVDDQALIRSGIRSLLEAEDDIEIVGKQPMDSTESHLSGNTGPTSR